MSVVVGASIVTVGTSRRSRRSRRWGAGWALPAAARAASSTAAGKADRMPWRTTQRSRPRSAPTGTVRAGTTWVPRIAATTNAPSSRASADPSSKGQSVFATTRSTRRKRRQPWVVTAPKSSVRCALDQGERARARCSPPSATVTVALTRSPSRKGFEVRRRRRTPRCSPSGPSRLRKPNPRGWMEDAAVGCRRAWLSCIARAPYPKPLRRGALVRASPPWQPPPGSPFVPRLGRRDHLGRPRPPHAAEARDPPGRRRREFPGGKVEPDEDPRDALVRELAEELGVTATVGDIVEVTFHRYPSEERAPPLLRDAPRAPGSPEPRASTWPRCAGPRRSDLRDALFPPADVAVLAKVRAMLGAARIAAGAAAPTAEAPPNLPLLTVTGAARDRPTRPLSSSSSASYRGGGDGALGALGFPVLRAIGSRLPWPDRERVPAGRRQTPAARLTPRRETVGSVLRRRRAARSRGGARGGDHRRPAWVKISTSPRISRPCWRGAGCRGMAAELLPEARGPTRSRRGP